MLRAFWSRSWSADRLSIFWGADPSSLHWGGNAMQGRSLHAWQLLLVAPLFWRRSRHNTQVRRGACRRVVMHQKGPLLKGDNSEVFIFFLADTWRGLSFPWTAVRVVYCVCGRVLLTWYVRFFRRLRIRVDGMHILSRYWTLKLVVYILRTWLTMEHPIWLGLCDLLLNWRTVFSYRLNGRTIGHPSLIRLSVII